MACCHHALCGKYESALLCELNTEPLLPFVFLTFFLWNIKIHIYIYIYILILQETPESHNGRSSSQRQARPKGSVTCLKSRSRCVYDIGPPAWVQKEMIASTLQNQLVRSTVSLLQGYSKFSTIYTYKISVEYVMLSKTRIGSYISLYML